MKLLLTLSLEVVDSTMLVLESIVWCCAMQLVYCMLLHHSQPSFLQ